MTENQNYIVPDSVLFIPHEIVTAAEAFTFFLSVLGMAISFYLYRFFKNDKRELSRRLSVEYMTDFWLFVTLAVMGFALYYNLPLIVKADVVVRPFVIAANIWAMWRLYKHYKSM